jgi:hypothetical protein
MLPAFPLSRRVRKMPFKLFQRRTIYCRSHVKTIEPVDTLCESSEIRLTRVAIPMSMLSSHVRTCHRSLACSTVRDAVLHQERV